MDLISLKISVRTLECWFRTSRRKFETFWTSEHKNMSVRKQSWNAFLTTFWHNNLVKFVKNLPNCLKRRLRCRFGLLRNAAINPLAFSPKWCNQLLTSWESKPHYIYCWEVQIATDVVWCIPRLMSPVKDLFF